MRSSRTPSLLLLRTALVALLVAGLSGCPKPVRRKGTVAPPPTTGKLALEVTPIKKEKVLPPPTMTPAQVRQALWDIQARQRRGEAGKALNDYHDRAQTLQTLESRFLAAAAIPDEDAAWKAFKAIADDQPKFYWAHAGMAAIYVRWKIRDQCEKELNTAFELGPDIPYTYTLRGDLYRKLGEHALAVRDYSIALRADPADADARTGLALSQQALGNVQTFEQELKQALQSVPTHYEAAEALALFFDEKNRIADARQAWELVAQLAPRNRAARLALARLKGDVDPAGAIAAYEAAAKLSPLNKTEQTSLARLYRKVRRTDDEVAALEVLTRLEAGDVGPWRRLAEIHLERNDLPALETAYKAILAVDDKDVPALTGLAMVYEKRAQILDAIGWFQRAKEAGSAVAETEIARLAEACMLPEQPITGGNLTVYFRRIAESLEKLYEERKKQAAGLKGYVKVRIVNDGEGNVAEVQVQENSLNDPWIEAHAHYAVLNSRLPAGVPRSFSLTFDLPPERR